MHCTDIVQHVLVASDDTQARDEEVEPELHLQESPQREVVPYPEEREIT